MFVKINVIYVNLCNKLMLSVLELLFQGSFTVISNGNTFC